MIDNTTKKNLRKIFNSALNLVLLALILIIWSCSTTETTDSTPRVDTIELYESRVPLIYTGTNADGTPNENLLLSGFVKYPADGRLLNFTVADNEYGITVDTTSDDPFQYSMLQVADSGITTNINIATMVSIEVVITAKNGPGRTNLTMSSIAPYEASFGPNGERSSGAVSETSGTFGAGQGFHYAGLNRRVVPDGCEVKFSSVVNSANSTFAFNWFARFMDGDGVYNGSTNINLALDGLNGRGGVRVIPQTSVFNSITDSSSSVRTVLDHYTIVNSPNQLFPNIRSPWYSGVIFTIPRPGHPDFAGTPSNPTNAGYNANVRRGTPMQFLAGTTTFEQITHHAIDHQCRTIEVY